MKRVFTLTMVIAIMLTAFAQSPQKMSYQCVIRNFSGELVTNHAVGMKISILQGSATGTVVFSETYNPASQTNANGLVSIEIGSGTPVIGTFSDINWSDGAYFLKTETDPAGGTSYTITGTSQLLSVPYAIYSKTTENLTDNSVTSAKIANNAVTVGKLPAGATTDKYLRGDGTWALPLLNLPYSGTTSEGTFGISIEHTGSVGESHGGLFKSSSASGIGVSGRAFVTNGYSWGGYFTSNSDYGVGVWGEAYTNNGKNFGGFFITNSTDGAGVYGTAVASEGTTYGVMGDVSSPSGFSGHFTGGKFYIEGNVGIGTDNPAYKLDISGQVNLNKGISSAAALRCNGAEALWYNGIYFSWGYGSTETYNYFARKVAIGTNDDPGTNLLVVNGTAAKPGGGTWATWSDSRLKDIHGSYSKGLDEITNLQPVSYSYIKDNSLKLPDDRDYVGLVAQEVQKIFPEAVSVGRDGFLQLDLNPVNIALINAVKELKADNDEMKARLETIESLLGAKSKR